jgi:hypothetical protein
MEFILQEIKIFVNGLVDVVPAQSTHFNRFNHRPTYL